MEQKLYDTLRDLQIDYEKFEHEPFFTCEDSQAFYDQHMGGGHFKTLFLRNKPKTRWVLAIVEEHRKADLKELQTFLGDNKRYSFGAPEYLLDMMGLTPGSVTPFGLIHPNAAALEIVVDEGLCDHEHVHFHPLRNTATLKLRRDDFLRFLESRENTMTFYRF